MAVTSDIEWPRDRVEELDSPQSPGADYGLRNDFDPAKYDFYNPILHKARQASAGRLEEERSAAINKQEEVDVRPVDTHDSGEPEPLSPIEELDDEAQSIRLPRQSTDSVLSTSSRDVATKKATTDDLGHASLNEDTGDFLPLEYRVELLFSRQHLQAIFADRVLTVKFTTFLRTHRPDSVPILTYYLDAIKALKTIRYAESIIRGLEPISGHAFTTKANSATMPWVLEDKADRALDVLVTEDMPAFIAYIYVKMVDLALVDRVTGKQDSASRAVANGLAEVFVLSDPARPDNPIVFSSDEFHSLTGYSRKEFLGHNCRILGGRKTSPFGISRFRASLDAEQEHCEVLLNYRQDGSPFINLIMCVPLRDQANNVRYYLGAQLDITELVNNCVEFSSLHKVFQQGKHSKSTTSSDVTSDISVVDEFAELSKTFNSQELEKLSMTKRREQADYANPLSDKDLPLKRPSSELADFRAGGIAPALGFYQNYLLVRPHPSLRILFASPELRISGILQQPLVKSIGGSSRVREDLVHALEIGRKVTAKVQWLSPLSKSNDCWIHCTPLLGIDESVGVWMVILVDADADEHTSKYHEVEPESRANAVRGGKYTEDPFSRETTRKDKSTAGASIVLLTNGDPNVQDEDEMVRAKPKKVGRGPISDSAQSPHPSTVKMDSAGRTGGQINNPSDERNAAMHEEYSKRGNDSRQKSVDNRHLSYDRRPLNRDDRSLSSASGELPIQSQSRPIVKIAGRPSFEGKVVKPLPINMPGQPESSAKDDPDGLRPIRKRTYKSLSPYGIIFND